MKQFTMSMFLTTEDLYKAKADHYQEELKRALYMLKGFLEFAEIQNKADLVDDPEYLMDGAEVMLKEYEKLLLPEESFCM